MLALHRLKECKMPFLRKIEHVTPSTGHPRHVDTSSPPSSPAPSQEGGRRKQSFDILAANTLSVFTSRRTFNTRISSYQVMICKTTQLRWLNSQILEGLRRRINFLIDKFSFHTIGTHLCPPKAFVDEICNWFQDPFGNIDVPPMLDDFAVYELGDFGHGVVRWAVELVGLGGGVIVMEHDFEGLAYVYCLIYESVLANI